jgi:hypothetical protein
MSLCTNFLSQDKDRNRIQDFMELEAYIVWWTLFKGKEYKIRYRVLEVNYASEVPKSKALVTSQKIFLWHWTQGEQLLMP